MTDQRAHYAVKVVDFPPTELTCKCGEVFFGDDPIGQLKAHMDELNDPSPDSPTERQRL